jgi:catechol 2,3-dioxygenase-like lactoylglutathione lyase family enzyme
VVSGFHHVTLKVTDLERSRRFYEALSGFAVDQDIPGYKVRFRIGTTAARRLDLLLGLSSRASGPGRRAGGRHGGVRRPPVLAAHPVPVAHPVLAAHPLGDQRL